MGVIRTWKFSQEPQHCQELKFTQYVRRMCVCVCMQKKISEFTYLFISCPHFRGHGTSRKLHHFSLCLSSSFFLMRVPHVLFANQLMLEFIRSFHFPFAFTSQYLKLGTPSHVVFGVVQGKFFLTPTTLALL